MANKPLSPSQVAKLQEVFGAALRKADPPDQEAQELIESHWSELEPELMAGFTAAVNKVLARVRNIIRLAIPSIKGFSKPDWMDRLTKDVEVAPGTYSLTFEEFHLDGEATVNGDETVRRANASGAISGLQHALWLLDSQHLIPAGLRGNYLVFAGAEALDSSGNRIVPYLSWRGGRWVLDWNWLDDDFDRSGLLVRARKS